jgi:hypothetical protein
MPHLYPVKRPAIYARDDIINPALLSEKFGKGAG